MTTNKILKELCKKANVESALNLIDMPIRILISKNNNEYFTKIKKILVYGGRNREVKITIEDNYSESRDKYEPTWIVFSAKEKKWALVHPFKHGRDVILSEPLFVEISFD